MKDKREEALTHQRFHIAIGEHEAPVVTLGRHANRTQILFPQTLEQKHIAVVPVERGGGATLHGPGQVVLYPILSLNHFRKTIPELTFIFEEAMICTLRNLGIKAQRSVTGPGVYVDLLKIGSIGFHVHQSVLTHGLSLNVHNDLGLYSLIEPCGQKNALCTSVAMLKNNFPSCIETGRLILNNLKSSL